jgi:hypothetical protein
VRSPGASSLVNVWLPENSAVKPTGGFWAVATVRRQALRSEEAERLELRLTVAVWKACFPTLKVIVLNRRVD